MNNDCPKPKGWIGIDLDGTLAEYHGWKGGDHIGKPVPGAMDFVRWLLEQGWEVRIFTARAGPQTGGAQDIVHGIQAVRAWCMKHLGQELRVTAEKDFGMVWLYDDRCTQVIPNLGKPVDPPEGYPNDAPHTARKPIKERNDNGRTKRPNGTQDAPAGVPDPGTGPIPS